MQTKQETAKTETCPFEHAYSFQKTARQIEPMNRPIEQTGDGIWHIRDYDLAREVLLSSDTRQAGFNVELADQMPGMNQKPVLFQDGKEHRIQRKEIARFFSPKTTSDKYQEMMEEYSTQMIAELLRRGNLELSELTMDLAVKVAAQVVGLTNSLLPGMAARLNGFLDFDPTSAEFSWRPDQIRNLLKTNLSMLAFYVLDVRPAIKARKKTRQEDVISHLIDKGYGDAEILMECITYGAAGMVTTREFILVATWHLLENPELRQIYLQGNVDERQLLLQEILRLEPVVSDLYRRAAADIELEVSGERIMIQQGDLIDLHLYAVNTDQSVVGEEALSICPGRPLEKRAQPPVMAFGFGHHRCPGAYIAIQESDIFLKKLLAVESLRLNSQPIVVYNELIKGYEIRNFRVAA